MLTPIFSSDFESGTFGDFDIVSNNSINKCYTQDRTVLTGSRAAYLEVTPHWLYRDPPGVRLAWMNCRGDKAAAPDNPKNLPDAAVYSAWYYLPQHYDTSWCVLMQWKQVHEQDFGRDPTILIPFVGKNGQMILQLDSKVGDDGQHTATQGKTLARSAIPLPVARWFCITTLYIWSKEEKGMVLTYLNNDELWLVQGIRTEFDRPFSAHPRQIVWSNYAKDCKPSSLGVYIDRVKVEN